MEPVDTLLSLDLSLHDAYYRFRRDFERAGTVVYVFIEDLSIIPEDQRTWGPDVVKFLSKSVEGWNQHWTTLTVFRRNSKVESLQDKWQPHFVPPAVVSCHIPRVNVLDLRVQRGLKSRVSYVEYGSQGKRHVLKICPFQYQLPYMVRELGAYEILRERECALVPRIAAYVYERDESQVVGFICEELEGRFAGPDDHEECKNSLQHFHSYGVLHGDLNRFNIIITQNGPRFIDLEKATFDVNADLPAQDFLNQQSLELRGLEKALHDPEEWGKPWQ